MSSRKKTPRQDTTATDELHWIDAGKGYCLALDGEKLVARNPKGQRLASVPKALQESEACEQLQDLKAWMAQHQRECQEQVETWMLRSLPVPRALFEAVWQDLSWRRELENAVIIPILEDASLDHENAGMLKAVDPTRGLGVVNLDGETLWLTATRVSIPHPILLSELPTLRELCSDLGLSQVLSQLYRETWDKPVELEPEQTSLDDFSGAEFEELNFALGCCRSLGFRVRGGFATCPVWEGGSLFEARFWIGADSPDCETTTGELCWVDTSERSIPIARVGPVAFSEGKRMASMIHAAAKKTEEEEET